MEISNMDWGKFAEKNWRWSWFTYFFIGFLCIALAVSLTGTTISFYQEYTFMPNTPFESTETWYHINRLDNSFWDIFNSVNNVMEKVVFEIPRIPSINIIGSYGGWTFIIDAVVFLTNSLITVINVVSSVYNGLVNIFNTMVTFVVAFSSWVANSSSHVVPR